MSLAFFRLDVRNTFASGSRILAPLVLAAVVAAALPLPAIAVAIAVAVGSLSASSPFLSDERGRLDLLYSTLPVSRTGVVVGRYATLLVVYLVTAAVATCAGLVSASVRGGSIDVGQLGWAHAAGFLLVALALSVQLPVFFAVGFTRARPMMYLPVIVLAAAAWGAGRIGLDVPVGLITPASGALLAGGAVVLGAAALAGSAGISIHAYRRRGL